MAKKKKRKEEKKKDTGYKTELKGIMLVLLTIIGFCPFGIASSIVKGFSAFLVGTWWGVVLLIVGISGGYIIVKRKYPNFFTSRMVGLYIILIGILTLLHTGYINELMEINETTKIGFIELMEETIGNLMNFVNGITEIQGGGILGALFSYLFVLMLTISGTKVISVTIIICGFIMFTGITIYDIVKWSNNKVKKAVNKTKEMSLKTRDKEKENKNEILKKANEYENDNKVVVSSIDELINIADPKDELVINNGLGNDKEEILEIDLENIDGEGYNYPPITLLKRPVNSKKSETTEEINEKAQKLVQVLKDFTIEGNVVAANVGPTVTQYEIETKSGTKVSRILSLNREIALALAARDVRIQAPIPGKSTIGIEIPNKVTSMVTVREILENIPKNLEESKLLVTLGKNIMGIPQYCEINKTPHLLVAGATGSGKSVCINSIIISLLMRTRPDELKLVLVDPKKVELSMYNGVPHLLAPVVTDPKKANIALKKIVVEMEKRYDMFSDTGTKNIAGYNEYVEQENKKRSEDNKLNKLPFIVVIIDELADLMLVAAKEVEDSIMRITQMARAAGIHLIVATQRPSTDVITGVVKANIPSRVSFSVSSSIDSRTILDASGAEKLLGKGDMLFLPQGENSPIRIQGTFISDEEIKAVVNYVCKQQKAKYDESLTMSDDELNAKTSFHNEEYDDPLYNEIVEYVVTSGKASTSLLQRRFRLGYNRAARCIDLLEERGIIGPSNGSKPREVLVKLEDKNE
ncbi:MAG TPA: DNA translocase FtsK [Tenericutes bacterium]|nr:DNA translocase FtsK [Mycoplasmatota bacterium]